MEPSLHARAIRVSMCSFSRAPRAGHAGWGRRKGRVQQVRPELRPACSRGSGLHSRRQNAVSGMELRAIGAGLPRNTPLKRWFASSSVLKSLETPKMRLLFPLSGPYPCFTERGYHPCGTTAGGSFQRLRAIHLFEIFSVSALRAQPDAFQTCLPCWFVRGVAQGARHGGVPRDNPSIGLESPRQVVHAFEKIAETRFAVREGPEPWRRVVLTAHAQI